MITAPALNAVGSTARPVDGRQSSCKEIGGFTRAKELLRRCRTYLDRDGDGVAYVSLSGGRQNHMGVDMAEGVDNFEVTDGLIYGTVRI